MTAADPIALVERALTELIRDWERFFAGDLRVPPHDRHERLERRLRNLSQHPPRRRADQFRLEQLQHRFMAYAMNWERMLREREEGRGRPAAAVPARPPSAETPANGPGSGSVDLGESGALYDRYVAAKRDQGLEVQVNREAFEAQLASERSKLEARLGQKVRFDVLVEDGKVKLAARKVRSRGTGE